MSMIVAVVSLPLKTRSPVCPRSRLEVRVEADKIPLLVELPVSATAGRMKVDRAPKARPVDARCRVRP